MKFDAMEKKFENKFDKIDMKFDKIDMKFDNIENKMEKLADNVNGVNSRFNSNATGLAFAAVVGFSAISNAVINVLKYWDEAH